MSTMERDAVAAICLLAAFADGQPDEQERARIKAVVDGMPEGGGVSNEVYQRVIFRQTDGATEAARLSSPEVKRFAYEMAVSVCNADGTTSSAERGFLDGLAVACGLSPEDSAARVRLGDQIANQPVGVPADVGFVGGSASAVPAGVSSGAASANQQDKEIDASITNYAILTGALEILPHGLASAGIIPLQVKMVYEIGKRYGYSLDSGHIKDFLATAGLGMTSQMVESFASRIMGGLIGSVGGAVFGRAGAGMLAGLGRAATGTAFSFAATYALGQVAKQYYAGGRTLSAIDLRAVFTEQVASARGVYEQYRPRIEEQARAVNPSQILNIVRGI